MSPTRRRRSDRAGTLVEVRFGFRAVSIFGKLMLPLGKLVLGPMKKCSGKDLENLKAVADTRAGSDG